VEKWAASAAPKREVLRAARRRAAVVDREKAPRVRGVLTVREASRRALDRARRWLSQAWWDMRRRGGQLWIIRAGRQLCWRVRMRANEGVCSVEIANRYVGFFGQMNWCLFIFQYCECKGLFPDIRLTGDGYLDLVRGPNWLEYYFHVLTPISKEEIGKRIRYTKKISDFKEMGPPIAPDMTVREGGRILHKYLTQKTNINSLVDAFWRDSGFDGPVLGVHFRGTDKSSEAPRVSWRHCLTVVKNYLRNHHAVFVASDEEEFIEFMKKSITELPVFFREDHYRSRGSGEVPVFLGKGGGYEKGEDALVNCLLLAKCSALVRTTSFLSAWASIFNPDLKVILLNKPYDNRLWYPEREILRSPGTDYVPEL
jgi:hypothetical protein